MTVQSITISIVGVNIRVDCDDRGSHEILAINFEAMMAIADSCQLEYFVQSNVGTNGIVVSRRHSEFRATARDVGELIYFLEGDLVIQLQLLRSDLLFLHSAVVSDGRKAHLFTGPSGAGKSTTCWGLLHHGFHYFSDELAPISLGQASVAPYSHALCLKSAPPSGYPAPDEAIVTDRGIHIPPSAIPSPNMQSDLPVGSIFFVKHQPDAETAAIEQVGNAEAATRLYPNILNALAHGNDGLDAALQLTKDVSCYRVDAADLASTCEAITSAVQR